MRNRTSCRLAGGALAVALVLGGCHAAAGAAQGPSLHAIPEWFSAPCASDSVDDFGWPLSEMMGIGIHVPSVFRRERIPQVDELYFRRGQATLRLYLRRDASRIFASYAESAMRHRHCEGEIGGYLAEAISFRDGLLFGFAARWADAAQGEWLVAIVRARDIADATALRSALFTLRFPGEKR